MTSSAHVPPLLADSFADMSEPTEPLSMEGLVEKVRAYQSDLDASRLEKAYQFAKKYHGEQKRKSGEAYYFHPVEVASLLADRRMDETTILAGLLHDTVEDTELSLDTIEAEFGGDVAQLVDGLTKLPKFELQSEQTKQAENFQKFILASIKDLRILLVKIADRTHNMRTIHFLPEEKRQRISRETLDIFVPLARRVGLFEAASELEERCFEQIHPVARQSIIKQLKILEEERKFDLERVKNECVNLLKKHQIRARIKGRRKRPYSIFKKLERQSIAFNEVADIFAFRLILPDELLSDSYRVLGILHSEWAFIPGRFRDWLSVPKSNGYQSLHTTVRTSSNHLVEFQIRTESMHETAEWGVSAHWAYKGQTYGFDAERAEQAGIDAENSLRAFSELFEQGGEPGEFLEHAKLELYQDSVFCFTPKSKLIILPAGSMPLDFAYAVHSQVGNKTIGCRVNGTERPLRRVLNNGDVVDIITGKEAVALPAWQALATTARARFHQKRLMRSRDIMVVRRLGETLIQNALERVGLKLDALNYAEALTRLNYKSRDSLHEAVGKGHLTQKDFIKNVFPGMQEDTLHIAFQKRVDQNDVAQKMVNLGEDLNAAEMDFCPQCCPLPGDPIICIQTQGGAMRVHHTACKTLTSFEDTLNLWYNVHWRKTSDAFAQCIGRVRVVAKNGTGVLALICGAIAKVEGNIVRLQTGQRRPDFIEMILDIELASVTHLEQVLRNLRSLNVVDTAERGLDITV